jgi:3-deoxy-7-phosphoheptulonate synthase
MSTSAINPAVATAKIQPQSTPLALSTQEQLPNGSSSSKSNGHAHLNGGSSSSYSQQNQEYVYTNDARVTGYEPVLSPALLLHETPVTEAGTKTIARARGQASAIVNGLDDRLLVVVGPCSIHDPQQAMEYAKRLKEKMRECEGLVIIMRAYFESK